MPGQTAVPEGALRIVQGHGGLQGQRLACAAVSCGSGDWQQGEGTGAGQVRSAYSCFWQVQVHIVGGLAVSGQGRSDGVDLFVAGG